MKISRQDNADIGFVLWCLSSQAIDMDEFQKWVYHVIEVVNEPPGYIFDLLDFKGYMKDIHKIMGFVPSWSPSKDIINAISGITLVRGVIPFEPVNKEACRKALEQNPGVWAKYRELFPFIYLPDL